MKTEILENIGFTKGEIKVYLALLELGNVSSGAIINKSSVSRSKVYEIIEKLKAKGLISESIKENVRYFQASSPERILDYIKIKERLLEEKEQEFKLLLPEISEKYKLSGEKQEVKVYTGIEGIKTFYNELLEQLQKGDEYLALTFSEDSLNNENILWIFNNFHLKRGEKGIPARIIYNIKDKITQEKLVFKNTKLWKRRITDQEIPTGIAITQDIVATVNWGKTPRAFVIICKDNADRYRYFFNALWEKGRDF